MNDNMIIGNIVISALALVTGIVLVWYDIRNNTKLEYMGYIVVLLACINALFTFIPMWFSLAIIVFRFYNILMGKFKIT